MPKTCVVPGCTSRRPSHAFPKDSTRLREWQLAINSQSIYQLTNDELTKGRTYCVCRLHFPPEAYETTKWPGRQRLKRNAIPTLHLNISANNSAASYGIRDDSMNMPIIKVQRLVTKSKKKKKKKKKNKKKTDGDPDSTSKKTKSSHNSKSEKKKKKKKIGLKKASRRQRIKDALKLMKTDYFQKLIASRKRSDKLYAEMQRRKTLHRPSSELMKLFQSVAETCPEYAQEYIYNMLIK